VIVIIVSFESAHKCTNIIINVLNFNFEVLDIMARLHRHVNQLSFKLISSIKHFIKGNLLHVLNSEVVAGKVAPDHKLQPISDGVLTWGNVEWLILLNDIGKWGDILLPVELAFVHLELGLLLVDHLVAHHVFRNKIRN